MSTQRQFLQTNWHVIVISAGTGVILCVMGLLLETMPPRGVAMATGPEGGGYQKIGKQYQALLERAGEKVRLVDGRQCGKFRVVT